MESKILRDCPVCGAAPARQMTADVGVDPIVLMYAVACGNEKCEANAGPVFASPDPLSAAAMWNEWADKQLEICRFTIELPPVTKKNHSEIRYNRRRDTHYIAPSRAYERYAASAGMFIPWPERLGLEGPISEPVNVKATYYMDSKRTVDIANLHSALHDVLVAAHLLADDNRDIIAGTDGSEVLYDKARPRTEVVITRKPGYEQWKKPGGGKR